jgi:hypothetical protein
MNTGTSINNDLMEELPSELEVLKNRATMLGVKFHPSIGLEKLKLAVENALSDKPEASEEPVKGKAATAAKETEAQVKMRLNKEANALVRVRVACMNPAKKDWQGEVFTVSNSAVGTIKKFVPFNNEEGWHVPEMILGVMRERQCQIFVTEVAKDGTKLRKGKLIKEFNIEVMPALTLKELEELAQRQAMNQSIDK